MALRQTPKNATQIVAPGGSVEEDEMVRLGRAQGAVAVERRYVAQSAILKLAQRHAPVVFLGSFEKYPRPDLPGRVRQRSNLLHSTTGLDVQRPSRWQ